MKDSNRTDKILIAIALLVLLLAVGFFHFDQWMWGSRKERGEKIGMIVQRTGDVRLKFDDDLKWQKASKDQDLAYNDAIYAGAGSQADLKVGESKLTVTENTLIILRREQDVSFLNLNYGVLFGRIAKNDKVVIDTGDGKPIEFTSKTDTQIVLKRKNGKTQLDVTAGQARVKVGGKVSQIDKSSSLVSGEKVPVAIQPNHLRAFKPLKDQVLSSEQPTRIDFAWGWDRPRNPDPSERYILEFAQDPEFKKIHIRKTVQGALTTEMTVSQSISLWYHVKGPEGETSQTERVQFIRLEKPFIVRPQASSKYETAKGQSAVIQIEFRKPSAASVWYQLASDPEFKTILANQNTSELIQIKELSTGQYYLRARSDFGQGKTTDWTETVPFSVEAKMEILPLANVHLPTRVIIPNRAYPRTLYWAPSEMVQSYLANHGLLHDFFPFKLEEMDELKVQMESEGRELFVQKDGAWPQQKLKPGRYQYQYQAAKSGFLPSAWSSSKGLEIVMEPPRPLGEATYGEPDPSNGLRPAQWGFTPLLFAKSYDLEVATNLSFSEALEFKSEKPVAETELPEGEYFWRARARDRFGRIISPFSQPYKLKSMPQKIPQALAKAEPVLTPIRRPSAAERTSTRIERVRERAWERSGWWGWLGTGENYVDYRQSLPGTGSVDAHHLKGGSQYVEMGYLNGRGYGGVISYKNTPGEFSVAEVPVNPNTYQWTTLAVEGMVKRTADFSLVGTPVVYGLRAGIQQHRIPFLSLNADATSIDLKNNEMTAASFGLLAEMTRSRWTYYWTMRYQFPMTSKADGASSFSMSPVFAFDGSLGTSYNLTQRMKVGFFWYGQWHQMNFSYDDGTVTNSGFQSLFYSNMDLRLGFDF